MLQCVDYSNYNNNNNEGIIVKLLHLEENYKIIYNLNDKCEKNCHMDIVLGLTYV